MNPTDKFFNDLIKVLEQNAAPKCKKCGTTLDYVLDKGRLGCPECYNVFRHTLLELVPQIGNRHVGKRPTTNLEDLLVAALQEERYEEAAEIRKRMRNN